MNTAVVVAAVAVAAAAVVVADEHHSITVSEHVYPDSPSAEHELAVELELELQHALDSPSLEHELVEQKRY